MRTRSAKRERNNSDVGEQINATQLTVPLKSREPPSKRARIGTPIMTSHTEANRPCLDGMNTDILFEIAENLHPKDLVSLSRACDSTQAAFLYNPQAVLSWRRSRERTGAPPPPEDMTEPRWARLIFDPRCMSCNTTMVQNIDFSIRRRACLKCKRENLVLASGFHSEFPKLDATILKIVHHTRYPGALNRPHIDCYYWRSDINEMVDMIEKVKGGSHDKGARDNALKAFMQRRLTIMESMGKVGLQAQYNVWIKAQATAKKNKETEDRLMRLSNVYQRFVALGYTPEDISMTDLAGELNQEMKKGGVSDQAWPRVRRAIEPRILAAKEQRLETEDKITRNTRRRLFDDLYANYHLTVEHSQWKYLPASSALYDSPPVRDIIKSDPSIVVTEETFADCLQNLSEFIKSAKKKLKWVLLCVICSTAPAWRSMSPSPFEFQAEDFSQIDLAILPFKCKKCRLDLFGWDEVSSHHCESIREYTGQQYVAAHCTAHYVVNIVRLSGLDITTATVSEMDSLDLRYTCTVCKPDASKEWDIYGARGMAKAYTWRNCTRHISEKHYRETEEARRSLKFEVVPFEVAEMVRAQEQMLERAEGSQWACAHCAWPLPSPGSYTDVINHIKSEDGHNIVTPNEADLVNIRCKPVMYSVDYQAIPKPPYKAPVKCLAHAGNPSTREGHRCDLLPYDKYLGHALQSSCNGDDWIPQEGIDYVYLKGDQVPLIWREAYQPEDESV